MLVVAALLSLFPQIARAACPALGLYSTPITVNYDGLSPLTDYFAIFTVDSQTPIMAGQMRADAADLHFADSSCTEYAYWIEGGINTAATRIWVVIPNVPNGISNLAMYFGTGVATHVNDAADVFGASVAAVYPFSDGSGNLVNDPVGNYDLTGTVAPTWTAPGPSDPERPRPGLGAASDIGLLSAATSGPPIGTGAFTVLSVGSVSDGTFRYLGSLYGTEELRGWSLSAEDGTLWLQLADGVGSCAVGGVSPVTFGQWMMLGARRAVGSASVLFNGAPVSTASTSVSCPLDTIDVDQGALIGALDTTDIVPVAITGRLSLTLIYQAALSDVAVAALYASLLPATHPAFSVGVTTVSPVVTSANSTTFTVGLPGSFTFTATGTPTPTITVEGALPAGVTFNPETSALSGTPALGTAGTYPLLVQASNDPPAPPPFTGSDVALDLVTQNFTLTVARIGQTIEFAGPGSQVAATTVALVATASSGLTVTFASSTPAVCTVSGATASLLTGGTCTIVASQAGDVGSYDPAADVPRSFEVTRAAQTITFADPGPQPSGTTVALVATASSGLTVTLASTTPAVCTVAGATASLLTSGTCTIVASQAGDATYDAAENVTRSFEVASGSLAPDPPINISVSVDNAHVALRWTPAATGQAATMFLVEVGDAPGQTTVLARLTREQVEIGVLPRGDYYLRVRALNQHGLSLPSEEVSATVASTSQASAPPVAFNARVVENAVHLSWRPAAFGAPPETYVLEVGSQHLADDIGRFVLPGNTTSLSVPNVPPGRYVLRVRARNGAGYTPPGPEILVHVGAPAGCDVAPRTPVMLTPVVAGHNVAVTWLEWPGERPSFVLEAGTAPGASNLLVADIGGLTGIGATVGDGTYAVRVTPRNPCGSGPESAEALLTVNAATPAAPTDLAAVVAAGTVTFSWTPPSSGPLASSYVLEAGIAPGSTLVSFPVGSATTFVVAGAPPGSYVVRVRAVNASGPGAASAEIAVTIP